ncbi:MAG: hypothetical protein V1808_04805 [Candidatus Daviesbacteria bacterium]
MKKNILIGFLILVFFLTGCATSRHAITGASIGAVAGGIVCKGNLACIALGAALGGSVGNEFDQKRIDKARETYWKSRMEMQKINAENAVQIIEIGEDTEIIVVGDDGKIIEY